MTHNRHMPPARLTQPWRSFSGYRRQTQYTQRRVWQMWRRGRYRLDRLAMAWRRREVDL